MADRYWVGGTGNWSDTAHWSTSSGGASGASVPISTDNVITDTASNATAYTITINTAIVGTTFTIGDPAVGAVSFITDASKLRTLTLSGNMTVAATLSITGDSATNRLLIQSSVRGTARTITANAVALTNCDFADITGAGAAAPFTGTSLGDCLGNSGITFTTAADQYWYTTTTGAKTWSTVGNWFLGSGGTGGAGRVPLPQDNAIFDANSIGAASATITHDMPRSGKDVTWTGVTNTPTLRQDHSSSISGLFGSLTLSASMGLSVGGSGGTFALFGRGAHTISLQGLTSIVNWGFYGVGGTYTSQSDFVGFRLDLIAGTFDANGYTVTTSGVCWDSGSTATKSLLMGASTFVCAGNNATYGRLWDFAASGTTVVPGTSTIKFTDVTATDKSFRGGGKTYNNIWLSGAGSGAYNFTGNNTFNDFKISDGAKTIKFTAGTTTTVASLTGFDTNAATITSITAAAHTLAKSGGGTASVTGATISYSTASPTNTFHAVNSTDGGNNTNWLWDATLTGVGSTAAAGSVSVTAAAALTGAGATGAAGDLAVTMDVGLTGVAATTGISITVPTTVLALTGVAATVSIGEIGIGIGLTGVSGTGTAGSVSIPVNGVLTREASRYEFLRTAQTTVLVRQSTTPT